MSLINKNAFNRALAVALMMGTALTSQAGAADRNSAPIRYGHESATQRSQPQASGQQFASARHHARRSVRSNVFAYPDEPLPGSLRPEPALQRTAQFDAVTQAGLPYVDPVDYASYVKVGNPYTINGITYVPEENPFYDNVGIASWYGPGFHGRLTANGETYDMYDFTAAHPTLPLPSYVEVTNTETNETVIVRVNDRGPFARGREIDLSHAAAERISLIEPGSGEVRVRYLGPAPRADHAPPIQQPDPYETELFDVAYHSEQAPIMPATVMESVPSHYVQLSSFRDRSNAEAFRTEVSQLNSDVNVVFATVNGSRYYRVVLGPYATEDAARNNQQTMARLGHEGILIENP